jgi:hypothetical protein
MNGSHTSWPEVYPSFAAPSTTSQMLFSSLWEISIWAYFFDISVRVWLSFPPKVLNNPIALRASLVESIKAKILSSNSHSGENFKSLDNTSQCPLLTFQDMASCDCPMRPSPANKSRPLQMCQRTYRTTMLRGCIHHCQKLSA